MSLSLHRTRPTPALRHGLLAAALLAVLALGGCASSGQISDINARLDSIDQRLDDTAASASAAEMAAADAIARAQAAEANDRAAEMRANDASQKAAAAFEKTVRK